MGDNWNISKGIPKALLIVAHPDDETIFCGGTLLSYPVWNWNIVCVTMQNPDRFKEFSDAMNKYKELGVNIDSYSTLNKPDYNQDLSPEDYEEWKSSIKRLGFNPDIVFTHNQEGEYGHKHHIAVSKMVRELFTNVWGFVYPGNPTDKIKEVKLDKNIMDRKKWIYDTLYVSQASNRRNIWRNILDVRKYEFETDTEIFTSN